MFSFLLFLVSPLFLFHVLTPLILIQPCQAETADTAETVLACYYASKAVYRQDQGKFDVEDIDPFLCTHVIYAFAGLQESNGTIVSLDPYNDLYKGAYSRFTALKRINPNLKTLLAIGGRNQCFRIYSQMASSEASRSTFIDSCVKFLQKYGFDGLDLHLDFPAEQGSDTPDRANFALLMQEMKKRFLLHDLLLTAAVSARRTIIDNAYDVPTLARLDYVFLETYDFHGAWENFTHHHSPLYAYQYDVQEYLNTNYSINHCLDAGLPADKLVIGIGLYGRCYTLDDVSQNNIYAPASVPGTPGSFSHTPGFLGFNELCNLQHNESWTTIRDEDIVSPFSFFQTQWIAYDDVISVRNKTEYALYRGLAGAMVYSFDTDDFRGVCQKENFPLIKTIRNTLTPLRREPLRRMLAPTRPTTATTSTPPPITPSSVL